MKLIQIIRPLFFVAVGLHVLVLFVPVGASDPEVIEDVELSELSEDKKPAAAPGPSPVPDPNVAAAPAAATAAKPAATTGRRPAARATRAAATARPATPAATARPATPNVAVNSSSSTPSNNRQPVTPSPDNDANSSDNDSNDAQGGSFLSTYLDEDANENGANENNDNSSTTEDSGATSVLTALLAKVTQELPQHFQVFSQQLGDSLVYDASNTTDGSADARRARWRETLRQQSNINTVEQLASADLDPLALDSLTKVAYPIESSVQKDSVVQVDGHEIGLHERTISLCLSEEPHDAEVGVVINAQGEVVDEPMIIRSTGYEALNNEIKAKVDAFEDFPRDGEASPTENRTLKAYRFEVEVDYDAESCVSLADLKE